MTDSLPQPRGARLVPASPGWPAPSAGWPRVGHHGRVPGIYDEPELYEAACAYRDVPTEVDALLRWSGQSREPASAPVRSVLELAAGPAEHARELARRGLDATTVDLSP